MTHTHPHVPLAGDQHSAKRQAGERWRPDVMLRPGDLREAQVNPVTPVIVPGSHESMFTRPAELADALVQAATAR